ncbi:MAG: preprotein translocase subunit SecY [Patescibacteria group bacterium]|nr:preprotein translocase subunit SecY [Patescibacteria group bacterium]
MASVENVRKTIFSIWENKEIRNKLWFSILVIIVFRIMAAVPVPGVPLGALQQFFGSSGFGEVMSLVSGGVLQNATMVAIGLGPYINSSIIFQLMGSVIPKIEELQKEGAHGRKLLNMYTRLLTVPLAIVQSFVIYSLLKQYGIMEELVLLDLVNMIATLTAGAIIMMWLGELVSEMGIGGGSSLLIFAGILSGIPGSVKVNFGLMSSQTLMILAGLVVGVVLLVVFVNQAERRIPIQYARRVRSIGAAAESHIPLKLNQSGVMPVIFAMSLLSFPQLIAQFLTGDAVHENIKWVSEWVINQLDNVYVYNGLLVVAIIVFSLFYLFVVFNPDNIAENLQKQAAFIPGVRPGKQTSKYLSASALRLGILGAVFLAAIAVLPVLAKETGLITSAIISGTGMLIVVNTVLDMRRQVESMIVTRSYEHYM